MKNLCRICHAPLGNTLLELKNVPAAAQFMPSTPKEVAADKPVDLQLKCCTRCGVVQHTLEPVKYFREVIRASGVSEEMRNFRLEQFSDFLNRHNLAGKRIFEAGCGKGEYLEIMRDAGAAVTGVEYSQENINHCRGRNLDAVQEFFEHGSEKISDCPFDGFFVLNFLEHIPDIPSFLDGIRNNLKDNAPGIVEVPNFDMILKNNLLTEFSTEHIYNFTAANLKNILEANGFDVISIKTVWYNYIISAEVIKRTEPDFSNFASCIGNISEALYGFIKKHNKTVWWGAGHQALTTLAATGLSSKEIAFVIDSSPAKQGKYTFVSHIPIVSPEHLDNSGADSVIVACGGYSDEVANIVKQKYGSKLAMAILRENGIGIL